MNVPDILARWLRTHPGAVSRLGGYDVRVNPETGRFERRAAVTNAGTPVLNCLADDDDDDDPPARAVDALGPPPALLRNAAPERLPGEGPRLVLNESPLPPAERTRDLLVPPTLTW